MSLIMEKEFGGVDIIIELTDSGSVIMRLDRMDLAEERESELALVELGFAAPRLIRQYKHETQEPVLMMVTDEVMSPGLFELWGINVVEKVADMTGAFRVSKFTPGFLGLLAVAQDIAVEDIRKERMVEEEEDFFAIEEEPDWLEDRQGEDWVRTSEYMDEFGEERGWTEEPEEGEVDVYSMRKEMLEGGGMQEVDRVEDLEDETRKLWNSIQHLPLEYGVVSILMYVIDIFKSDMSRKGGIWGHQIVEVYNHIMDRSLQEIRTYTTPSRKGIAIAGFRRWTLARAVELVEGDFEE